MPHITTCPRCGTCYEEASEDLANSPYRSCKPCRHMSYLTEMPATDPMFRWALDLADIPTA